MVLSWRIEHLKKDNIRRTKISRWLGRENEENVAWTRNCRGWPSYPRTKHLGPLQRVHDVEANIKEVTSEINSKTSE